MNLPTTLRKNNLKNSQSIVPRFQRKIKCMTRQNIAGKHQTNDNKMKNSEAINTNLLSRKI